MFIRNAFNYDRNLASRESGYVSTEPSLTKQSFREEADINVIVKRFRLTGELPQGVRVPQYGDFSGVDDFASALRVLEDAESAFMAMPSAIRSRFRNDPSEFLAFVHNPENKAEALSLGLVVKPEGVVDVVEPPRPAASPGAANANVIGSAVVSAPAGKGGG